MKLVCAFLVIISMLFTNIGFAKHGQGIQGGPPGLKSMPHGLEMQNKTPEGWSKGKKTGWTKSKTKSKKSKKKTKKSKKTKRFRSRDVNPIETLNND